MVQIKRKPKRHLRKSFVILCLVIVIAVTLIIRIPIMITDHKLQKLGYSHKTAEIIRHTGYASRVIDYGYYSDYLSDCYQNGTVNPDYLPLYLEMYENRTLTDDDFLLCQRLQDIGYETDQIQNLFANLSFDEILPLLVFDYQFSESAYIDDVVNNRETNTESSFALSADYSSRADAKTVASFSDDMLVSDKRIMENIAPEDLTDLDTTYSAAGIQLSENAADAFLKMAAAAAADGVSVYAVTGYISYDDQAASWQNAVNNYGDYAAYYGGVQAGCSEHQTGRAVNVSSVGYEGQDFETTPAYAWLQENAADYGFILRYPQGQEEITDSSFEPSHLRYVGKDLAEAVNKSGMTYDEFYLLYLDAWDDARYIPAEDVLEGTSWTVNTDADHNSMAEPSASPSEAASAVPAETSSAE